MALYRITANQTLSGGKIPKGTTIQVVVPNGSLDSYKIAAAFKQQMGIDVPNNHVYANLFNIEKIS